MVRRTEDAQHREGLVEILAVLLGPNLDDMYRHNGQFTTYAQVVLRKLLPAVRRNAQLHCPALPPETCEIILKDKDIVRQFEDLTRA